MMRGGTSKAAFFHAADLPQDKAERDRVLLAVMGSPDLRQIDGIGGANPLTTKVAIISASQDDEADIDYLFGQVVIGEGRVDYAPTCGNILSAVGPFAIEEGLIAGQDGQTVVRIRMVNTGGVCDAVISTPHGRVNYRGDTHISGVPNPGAPIELRFFDIAGSSCGALYPTGAKCEQVDGIDITCIDNGMPVVLLRAADLGITGYETPQELDANATLKAAVESIRLQAGERMGLGDVSNKVVPKMTLVAAARDGGHLCTRTFIPKRCHDAIGVLGAASVATAFADPDTVCAGNASSHQSVLDVSVEHPTGEFTIRLSQLDQPGTPPQVALLRTARALFAGRALIQE